MYIYRIYMCVYIEYMCVCVCVYRIKFSSSPSIHFTGYKIEFVISYQIPSCAWQCVVTAEAKLTDQECQTSKG